METISPMNTPQGALFLARLPETTLPERLEAAGIVAPLTRELRAWSRAWHPRTPRCCRSTSLS